MEEENKVNEFDTLGDEEFQGTSSGGQHTQNSLVSSNAGVEYNWEDMPDTIKAPPRESLDGEEVIIEQAKIILPPLEQDWDKTRDGSKNYKYCVFKLFYNKNGQQEFYSGIRVFENNGKYSVPTIMTDRKNQASQLLGHYADFKQKDIKECTLKELMHFLNSKPKAVIKGMPVNNPTTGATITKNMVEKFI